MIDVRNSLVAHDSVKLEWKIMNKIIVLLSASFLLSACGATSTTVGTAQDGPKDEVESPAGDAIEATEVQVAANDSGLGTIAYDKNTRAKPCKRQRRTGSHLFSDGCADPDSGSQPVRYGTFNDLGRLVMSGSVRPEN